MEPEGFKRREAEIQLRTGGVWVRGAGNSDALGIMCWGPEFEIPANNRYRTSGDSVAGMRGAKSQRRK